MKSRIDNPANERRDFLKNVATGAAALGLSMFAPPFKLSAGTLDGSAGDADAWFNQLDKKGKHRIVFDVPEPNEMLPFAWPKIFTINEC